jgi:hypothetical protein
MGHAAPNSLGLFFSAGPRHWAWRVLLAQPAIGSYSLITKSSLVYDPRRWQRDTRF